MTEQFSVVRAVSNAMFEKVLGTKSRRKEAKLVLENCRSHFALQKPKRREEAKLVLKLSAIVRTINHIEMVGWLVVVVLVGVPLDSLPVLHRIYA